LPGLVLAHDAYQLLREGAAGAVSSPAAAAKLRREATAAAAAPLVTARAADDDSGARRLLAAALPPAAAAAVAERAVRPDEFYRQVFRDGLSRPDAPPRAAALYLPGLDIAALGWRGGDVALGDLVRAELGAADRLLAGAMTQPGWGAVAVVLDPGRRPPSRGGAGGRVLLWQRRGCGAGPAETTPEAITSGLLRTLGLPQSAELPPPPAQCRWPEPPATVSDYGRPQPRRLPGAPPEDAAEYLRNLHSLGYL
ncbi:MAG: hypothetical protein JOZ15_05785, partial [Acidobacteria bacterium]|nr:hypothetical protein [Acidobacteriota bacterium]